MNKINIQKVKKVVAVYRELIKIAKTLHKMDEYDCNYSCNPAHETRENNLFLKADELAKELGLRAYHQGDPRGGTLYLVKNIKDAERNYYTNGVYIY